jgi:hypothetical protein
MTHTSQGISPLRQRMIDDMHMRKLAPKTQAGYVRVVRHFTAFLGRPPTPQLEDLRKGRRDRYAMLSPVLLERGWLFPGLDPVDPLSTRQLNRAIHAAAEAAHINKRVSMRRHGFFQSDRAALAPAQLHERTAEIVLHPRPIQRDALARGFGQRRAVCRHRFFQPGRAALALTQLAERIAEVVLRRRPIQREVFARAAMQRLSIHINRLEQRRVIASLVAMAQQCVTVTVEVIAASVAARVCGGFRAPPARPPWPGAGPALERGR